MRSLDMTTENTTARASERGSAAVKFLIFFVLLVLVGNAGYNFVPVAYAAENFKQEMQTAVINGLALPGRVSPIEVVKANIQRAARDNDLPDDAVIEVKQVGNTIQAHAIYSKRVSILPFGIYTYTYQFDHTAVPTGFLIKESR
jgi:hypothetical protein